MRRPATRRPVTRRIAAVIACSLVLAGCSDLYYRWIGEGNWPHEDNSLYSRLGGRPGLNRIVDGWVMAAYADPRINRLFTHTDLAGFKGTLVEQLCVKTAGPCVYTGPGMIDAHVGLVISKPDFDAFMEDLRTTLDAQRVHPKDQRLLFSVLKPMRAQVVEVAE